MITEIVNYKKFGKCIRLDNGSIEAYFTIDVGPRLIKFNCTDCTNMLFNDDPLERFVDVSAGFGEGKKWYTFGGHRMWISPEEMPKTYYPDQDPVEYDIKETENEVIVTLIAPVQKVTNLQQKWVVTMGKQGNELILDHYLTNAGSETVRKAIWGITVTDKNGIAVLREPENFAALLPNRQLALWPYTKLNDDRLLFGEKYIAVQQDPADTQVPAKIGYTNFEGKLYCFNYGQAMTISYDSDYTKGEYPDYGVSSEIYTNKAILEIESLGRLENIGAGETITHREVWSAVKCDYKPSLNEQSIGFAMEKAFG